MHFNKKFALAGISALGVIVLIALIRLIDVAPIGPEGTTVGLSHLNGWVHDLTGVHMVWYHLTDGLGIAAILTAFFFALIGFIELLQRRSLLKVDKILLALGGLYIAVAVLYLFFEIVVVNCRPVIMPGASEPEPSFPSSHTMLVCVIMGSAMMLWRRYIRSRRAGQVLTIISAVIAGGTVIGRLLSGVHWFTDIVGGVLVSLALLMLYAGVMEKLRKRKCRWRRRLSDTKREERDNDRIHKKES